MSFVIAAPDLVAMATEDLAGIGASLTAANAAAAVPTSGLLAAAGDEVSAAIAALFSSHGQQYQAMSAQAAAFHARFVQALAGAMGAYAAAEAANASPLQTLEQGLLGAINAPAAALSGRPFIGNGTNGAPGTGEAGGPGGWLLGNGGNGGSGAPGQTGGGLADPAGPAIAAVAIQQATRPAGLPGTRRTIGAVADQGAPEQRLRGRVDHIQRLLQRGGICGLGATICARSRAQGLDKPFMKRGRLRAECLIGLGVPGKQRRHRCRHLVGARGQHSGGRGQRRGIGRAQRRADLRQIVCCRCHHLRRRQYIRHRCPPAGSSLTDRLLLTLARTRVGVSSFYFLTWKNGGPDPASASQPSLAASTGDRDFGSGPSAVGAT